MSLHRRSMQLLRTRQAQGTRIFNLDVAALVSRDGDQAILHGALHDVLAPCFPSPWLFLACHELNMHVTRFPQQG